MFADSESAMIVAVPSATAVTSPADEPVATLGVVEAHVTVAPEITVPPASFTVALTVTVSPTDVRVFVLGESSTVDATCATVTAAVVLTEPETAKIVVVPLRTEVTSPADETVATVVALETHVTAAPGMAVPPASFTVAASVVVSAIDAKESDVGDNSMLDRI